MNDNQLDIIYGEVSVELRNPFPVLGAYSKSKVKQLFDSVRRVSEGAFKGIETNHPNGLYRGFTELQNNIEEKKVQYIDIMPLTVFVPSYLKPKVYFLPYLVELNKQIKLVSDITNHAATELEFIISGYIGNPQRLQDPDFVMTRTPKEYSLQGMQQRADAISKEMGKMIVQGGARSTRTFNEAFARVADWKDANRQAYEINDEFMKIIRRFDAISREVSEVNQLTSKLINLIDTDQRYAVSARVGEYLSNRIYEYAKLTELVGATLYATQVSLKAISDTNAAIQRAVG